MDRIIKQTVLTQISMFLNQQVDLTLLCLANILYLLFRAIFTSGLRVKEKIHSNCGCDQVFFMPSSSFSQSELSLRTRPITYK